MPLIVVESPTKIKTLSGLVGSGYEFAATYGHLFDLPESDMGVDEEYNPRWVATNDSAISYLEEKAAEHSTVYLASDPDREGEAIAWQVEEFILNGNTVHRMRLPSLTEDEVEKNLDDPPSLDRRKVRAQWARRILDRLAGYKVSSFLISAFKGKKLSAGRVQSAVLRKVVEREREIENFVPETYYELTADLLPEGKPPPVEARLVALGDLDLRGDDEARFTDRDPLEEVETGLEEHGIELVDRTVDQTETHPAYPPDSSTMIRLAGQWFGWSSGRTMTLAQQLYEKGLITYHRSDSQRLSKEACRKAAGFISENYGKEFHQWRGGKGGDQDGHEAVRPENPFLKPSDLKYVSDAHKLLYGLLWQRFVQSQMVPAEWDRMTLTFTVEDSDALLEGEVRRCREPGLYRCRLEGQESPAEKGLSDEAWDRVGSADEFFVDGTDLSEHETEGPRRYTEGSLIGMMKEQGIGRPSTYSSTVSKLKQREYIEVKDQRIHPTDRGIDVSDFLQRAVPRINDTGFTGEMETTLDEIARGKADWNEFVAGFDDRLEAWLEEGKDLEPEGDAEGFKEILDFAECPRCGSDLVKRKGSYGMFVHCQDEECDFSADPPAKTYKCPECGRHMYKPGGNRGTVYQCLAHPECEGKRPVGKPHMTLEEFNQSAPDCPECGDDMEMKKGRWGKFWGCTNYPDCDGTKSA